MDQMRRDVVGHGRERFAAEQGAGVERGRVGKVRVQRDLSIPNHPHVFVIGGMAFFEDERGIVPGVAPAAIQQTECAVGNILSDLKSKPPIVRQKINSFARQQFDLTTSFFLRFRAS
jgi:NADH dehydrogenase FAD-containing subunit